jgi:hypothetical protein
MAKFSQKMMGKEVGQADKYAVPHSMDGKKFGKEAHAATLSYAKDPNTLSAREMGPSTGVGRVSAGDPARNDVKTSGIETRGNGCATKGRMARGPMA